MECYSSKRCSDNRISRGGIMDDKLIIEALANAVKNKEMTIEQVPSVYKDKVSILLELATD